MRRDDDPDAPDGERSAGGRGPGARDGESHGSRRDTRIDRNEGEVRVKTPDGSEVRLKLPPLALATIREEILAARLSRPATPRTVLAMVLLEKDA
jgi:hypothetical protein